MKKLFVIALLLICYKAISQDHLIILRNDGTKTETRTALIDSVTFPGGTTMRIHNWDNSMTDIQLSDVDSLKLAPDTTTAKTDKEALISLYNATFGPNWTNDSNWCSDRPLNEWYGVKTDDKGRVIEIMLRDNKLSGIIPQDIGQLSKLVMLDLALNDLSGPIPSELGQLSNMLSLWLLANKLTGTIPPELGQLNNLRSLLLSNNQLSGSIPIELRHLDNITDLCLDGNQLTGSIPPELGELSNLRWLYLGYNQLTGPIPRELGKLNNLAYFFLCTNQLSGTIDPDLVPLLLNLKYLDITNNRFSGILPLALVNHPRWNEFAWYVYPGNNFNRTTVRMDDFTAVDIDGDTIDFKAIRQKNKLTVVYGWTSQCSAYFFETMRSVYQEYAHKGLEIIAFNRFDGGDVNLVRNIIENYQITWRNAIESPTNGAPYFKNFVESPGIFVVNQLGEIVYSTFMWDKAGDFEKFIASQLGPIHLYASTDYIKDGIVKKLQSATIGNGVDIVLMGDGFVDTTFAAGGIYEQRMNEAMENFFSVEPTKSYRNYFNVYSVNAVSKNGVFGDSSETVFSTKFGEKTFIEGNIDKIKQYALKVENLKIGETNIITILNSPRYSGTCYMYDDASVSFTPVVAFDDKEFAAVVHHEAIGHGLGKLGDEYIYNNSTIDETYRTNLAANQSNGWFQNLSLSSTILPWSHFIGNPNYTMVGVYEGGYFFSQGVWRSEQNSCMNNNVPYFNAPSREQIVKHILQAAGVKYSWDEFVKNDKYETEKIFIPKIYPTREKEPLAPPVIMNRKLFEK